MLDIQFLRENIEVIKAAAEKKQISCDFDDLLRTDSKRVELKTEIEALRAAASSQGADALATVQAKEAELHELMKRWQLLMLQVPNIPDMSVPAGSTDAHDRELHAWGETKEFAFTPRDHRALLRSLHMLEERHDAASNATGGLMSSLKGDGVGLLFALSRYAADFFTARGFETMLAPSLASREQLVAVAALPRDEAVVYKTQDNLYLTSGSHAGVMGLFSGQRIDHASLPLRRVAFAHSFVRPTNKAGEIEKVSLLGSESYGWEQMILCAAEHDLSVQLHDALQRHNEEFLESLLVPYKTVVCCAGKLGLEEAKRSMLMVWFGAERSYRQVSAISYAHDFLTRRLSLRYLDSGGKLRYAHSLSGTVPSLSHLLAALVEYGQQQDGSVVLPPLLAPYFGKEIIRTSSVL